MTGSRGMEETLHTPSVPGIGMREGRLDRWAPPSSRPIAVPCLTPEAHMAATPREWFAQFVGANPIAPPALIIVDPRWPGHLAAMRNGFADHPLVHLVPDLRQAD